jgi:glycosyltransferase involved in cell wall biosynthesis
MNVLVCAHSWVTETSGLGTVMKNLCQQLDRRGHTVIVLQDGQASVMRAKRLWGGEAYELNLRPPNVTGRAVRSGASFSLFLPGVLYQLLRLVRRRSIEIMNVHYPEECFVYAALCRRILAGRLALVTSVHGADLFPEGRPRARYSPSLRGLLGSSDAIVAPSRSFLDDVRSRFPRLGGRLVCIHNGVRAEEFAGAAPAPVDGERYLLCVAMHNEKKGLDTLIRAFARIAAADRSLKLRLAGDGPLRGELEALAGGLGLAGRVEFLGRCSRPEIVRLMKGALLFVLPSRSEPFGLTLLEAAVSRTPIVASAVGGIPEVIRHEVSGLLVPPGDAAALAAAVLRLRAEPDLAAALARAAHEIVSARFSWETMGARYEGLMSRLAPATGEGLQRLA